MYSCSILVLWCYHIHYYCVNIQILLLLFYLLIYDYYCGTIPSIDAASNRKLLQMLLKRTGFGTVEAVDDGRAAVQYCEAAALEGDPPKILFMDNTMPNLVRILQWLWYCM